MESTINKIRNNDDDNINSKELDNFKKQHKKDYACFKKVSEYIDNYEKSITEEVRFRE